MESDKVILGTVRKVLKKYHAKRVLVAVSGGIDSMVLLDVIAKIIPADSFGVVNVDHDLRPSSASEVEFVRAYCDDHGYKFYTTKWTNKPDDEVGMEAAGRDFRYNFFATIMNSDNFDTLLTAHHANDLAENILMKMIRSGNIYEVVSLKQERKFASGQLVRPLLDFSKQQLKHYGKDHDINHVQDETNFENITMRNRLRNNIFPELQSENGQLLSHFRLFDRQLVALIDLAVSQFQQIEQNMEINSDNSSIRGLLNPVKVLDSEQQTLFWGSFFTRKLDVSVSNRQIEQIITVISGADPNAEIDLEDGWRFIRSYNNFLINKPEKIEQSQVEMVLNQPVIFQNRQFVLKEATVDDATFSVSKIPKQIVLRNRNDGDKLLISNGKHQKISKRFINEKVPEYQRDKFPIILFDNQVVWVEKIYKISDYLKKGNYFFKIDIDEVEG
ncbi:tRNA lysidine(34) synthetase TilS [Companilactobacillus hulinensis]|uniref:tRNA lysidine(34) synthetase TilS n=1 Tax=Companilactobacillus hulinensis TaxID=2486007 RepID=UPI000F77956C|nr:tRNA lysidine(34) synthetase TilS [Companilactobacillus hulinensis]